jgi:YjbE family integral membrane protein
MNMEFWMALTQIMIVNIVLSGDNAVVIAMAARGLPEHQQKAAILWGSGGAVVLRVILTVVAVALLKVPFLQFVGGLLLVWIAYQLLVEEDEPVGEDPNGKNGLMAAVKTILVADVVMSLDNTLAIAGVAKGNYTLLGLGLALSIPLVVFGSAIIMKAMDKFPALVYIGAGLIAYTAGEMIDGDKALQPYMPHALHNTPYLALLITAVVIGIGLWHNLQAGRSAHDVLVADEHAAERMSNRLD